METPLVTGNENVLSHEISFSCFWSSKCTSKILKTSYGSFILQLSKTPTERKFPVAFFFFFALLLMFAHLMSWLIQLFYILSEQEKHQKNTICSSEIKHKEIATAQQRWLRLLMGCHCHITRQSALTWTWTIYKAVSAQVHLTSTSFIKSMRWKSPYSRPNNSAIQYNLFLNCSFYRSPFMQFIIFYTFIFYSFSFSKCPFGHIIC